MHHNLGTLCTKPASCGSANIAASARHNSNSVLEATRTTTQRRLAAISLWRRRHEPCCIAAADAAAARCAYNKPVCASSHSRATGTACSDTSEKHCASSSKHVVCLLLVENGLRNYFTTFFSRTAAVHTTDTPRFETKYNSLTSRGPATYLYT